MVRVLLILSVLWSSSALAGSSEDAAVDASRVLDQHCASLTGTEVTLKAGSLKEVATAWEGVSQAYDSDPQVYLLYWRGALAQCLGGFDEDARADLESFWLLSRESTSLTDQRRDAQRRLRLLGVTVSETAEAPRPPGPGLGAGIGLVAGGAVVAGLAGWQVSVLQEAEAAFTAGTLTRTALDAARRDGEQAAVASNVLTGTAVGMGLASVPLFLIEALGPPKVQTPSRSKTPTVVTPVPSLLGVPGGLVPGVVGRW